MDIAAAMEGLAGPELWRRRGFARAGRLAGSAHQHTMGSVAVRDLNGSGSRPISRVLSGRQSVAIIHLGPPSPAASSDLPESAAGHGIALLFGLAPGGVYLAAACCHLRGALLPHHFTLTGFPAVCFLLHFPSPWAGVTPGLLRPGVTWHPALRSPDFPPRLAAERLPGRLPDALSHASWSRVLCVGAALAAIGVFQTIKNLRG